MTSIHHEVVLAASPDKVYGVLTNAAQFSAATGKPAEIGPGDGAVFSLFGGPIEGRQVELVAGQRIVQAWRTKMWEPGVYSLVTFTLTPEGKGTKLAIHHVGYPQGEHAHLSAGWVSNYCEPLAKFLA